MKRIRDIMPSNLINEDTTPVMDVVLPDADEKLRAEGWRLHVYREYAEDNVFVASERVLPEKVADPRANRVLDSRRILLHPDEVAWLHARLGELLGACVGEPHTCDQELVAAAEGRTDRLIEENDQLRSQLATVTRERDEAKKHLDERIKWQLEAVLNLQTFRALFDASVAMREGHEGCVTEPPCGSCFRCDFDKAVDQAKVEVATGVDEFIEESAGFWGRFAAQMQKERDHAESQRDSLRRLLREALELARLSRREADDRLTAIKEDAGIE